MLAGAVFVGLLALSTTIGSFVGSASTTPSSHATIVPLTPIAAVSSHETRPEATRSYAPEPAAPAVDIVEGVPEPLEIGTAEPLPLLSEATTNAEPVGLVGTRTLTFGVGNTLADVIAARGGLPTFTSNHGEVRWWGSSQVIFDQDGHVASWVQGTPALNVRQPSRSRRYPLLGSGLLIALA